MSGTAENLRHACVSASELARHVWEALSPDQRTEMAWFYGHNPERHGVDAETVRRQLVAVGLLSNRWQASPWGAFVFEVNREAVAA